MNNHIEIVSYLVPGKVDVHASDADGWTALHNASSKVSFVTNYRFRIFLNPTSKGYLDIVMWLCEEGGAVSATDTGRGIDIQSKVGWTPLSNLCFQWLLSFGI